MNACDVFRCLRQRERFQELPPTTEETLMEEGHLGAQDGTTPPVDNAPSAQPVQPPARRALDDFGALEFGQL